MVLPKPATAGKRASSRLSGNPSAFSTSLSGLQVRTLGLQPVSFLIHCPHSLPLAHAFPMLRRTSDLLSSCNCTQAVALALRRLRQEIYNFSFKTSM